MAYKDEVIDLLRKLEPLSGSLSRKLWLWSIASDNKDAFENLRLLRLLGDRNAKLDYEKSIRLPPPDKRALTGEFYVGDVVYPDIVYGQLGISETDFVRHILIGGMTGAGKTNLTLNLLQQIAQSKVPFLVFDWKRNYRRLRNAGVENLRIIKPESKKHSIRFNPLIPPPGLKARDWLGLIVDVMKHAFFVSFGPEYFFRRGIHELYGRKGVYDKSGIYPTFSELEKLLRKEYVRGRELLWMSSVKRVLNALGESGILSHVVNVDSNEDIPFLFEGNVIVELDGLPVLERVFLTESLLLWNYHYRKSQGATNSLRHVIVVEEAHHVLSAKKERVGGSESIVELVLRMAREFGQGIIVVDQEPSKLSRSALANTGCKISLALGSGWDIKDMAECMGMDGKEKHSLGKLKIGQGIVKIGNRFSEPILIKVPLLQEISANELKGGGQE